jgi:hypothetical protein
VKLLAAVSICLLVLVTFSLRAEAEDPPRFVFGGAEITRHWNDTHDPNITLAQGRLAAHYLNGLVRAYLRAMEAASCRPGNPSACESLVRSVASRYGVDPGSAVTVARCESGLNPQASNGGSYLGLFQQSARYWAGRASHYGFGGASAYNARANASVSMGMVRDGGWGAWECRP